MSDSSLVFHCTRCGSTKFEMPEHPKDNDIVTCSGCGAKGKYGDIKKSMLGLARQHVDDMFSKALGPLFKRR
jgi:DNA-directed RNA polymerase subunit RPC12/RpoP